jgi:hypothetical protein
MLQSWVDWKQHGSGIAFFILSPSSSGTDVLDLPYAAVCNSRPGACKIEHCKLYLVMQYTWRLERIYLTPSGMGKHCLYHYSHIITILCRVYIPRDLHCPLELLTHLVNS